VTLCLKGLHALRTDDRLQSAVTGFELILRCPILSSRLQALRDGLVGPHCILRRRRACPAVNADRQARHGRRGRSSRRRNCRHCGTRRCDGWGQGHRLTLLSRPTVRPEARRSVWERGGRAHGEPGRDRDRGNPGKHHRRFVQARHQRDVIDADSIEDHSVGGVASFLQGERSRGATTLPRPRPTWAPNLRSCRPIGTPASRPKTACGDRPVMAEVV
jgi:hypothetical protein